MPTSFICEHTAEYLLARRIVDILFPEFGSSIPIHFWSTREGASVAGCGMSGKSVRVVATYARRPKILAPGQHSVLMKVNHQLFEAAAAAADLGVPVLAGLPLATELAGLSPEAACAWFRLIADGTAPADAELTISTDDPYGTPSRHPGVAGPIPEDCLVELIRSGASTWSWEDAVEVMRLVKRAGMQYGWPFGGGYQPFFTILPGDSPLRTLDAASRMQLRLRYRQY